MVIQKKHAEYLLRELGIAEPHEIDVEAVAAHCGAFVVYQELRGADARIVGNNDKAFITVRASAATSRKRFSIGHELGHWMWDRGKIAFSCNAEVLDHQWSRTGKESLANSFAAELLMPEFMFRPRLSASELTMRTVLKLAEEFQSSITATAIRVAECAHYPCMVIASSSAGRLWFRGSKEIEGKVWPVKTLDEYSFAHDMLVGKKANPIGGLVEADTWIDHPRASWYEIYESSVALSSNSVLSMIWWKTTKMLDELYGE